MFCFIMFIPQLSLFFWHWGSLLPCLDEFLSLAQLEASRNPVVRFLTHSVSFHDITTRIYFETHADFIIAKRATCLGRRPIHRNSDDTDNHSGEQSTVIGHGHRSKHFCEPPQGGIVASTSDDLFHPVSHFPSSQTFHLLNVPFNPNPWLCPFLSNALMPIIQ